MIVDETIANIKRAVEHFAKTDERLAAYIAGTPEAEVDPDEVSNTTGGATDADQVVAPIAAAWVPPVVGCPQWFLDEVRIAYGQENTDYEVDEIAGLKIIQHEKITEPILVMGDGKWYTVVPEWARQAAQQAQAEDGKRREQSAVFMPKEKVVIAPGEEIVTDGSDATTL